MLGGCCVGVGPPSVRRQRYAFDRGWIRTHVRASVCGVKNEKSLCVYVGMYIYIYTCLTWSGFIFVLIRSSLISFISLFVLFISPQPINLPTNNDIALSIIIRKTSASDTVRASPVLPRQEAREVSPCPPWQRILYFIMRGGPFPDRPRRRRNPAALGIPQDIYIYT